VEPVAIDHTKTGIDITFDRSKTSNSLPYYDTSDGQNQLAVSAEIQAERD